jgi:phosphoglycerate dehydrogenase-like enzyme
MPWNWRETPAHAESCLAERRIESAAPDVFEREPLLAIVDKKLGY